MSTMNSVHEGGLECHPATSEAGGDLISKADKAVDGSIDLDRDPSPAVLPPSGLEANLSKPPPVPTPEPGYISIADTDCSVEDSGPSSPLKPMLSSSATSSTGETGANAQVMQSVEISSTPTQVSINMESDDAKLQRDQIARIVEEKDLDSLQNFGGIHVIAEALVTDLENGLPFQIATRGFFIRLGRALNDYTVWLLLLAAGLSLFFGIEGMANALCDGFITIAVVMAIVVHNYLELDLSKISGQRKQAEMSRKVTVKRGGLQKEVSSSDVLVGDIVFLKSECLVPADGLFFESDESLALDDGSIVDANHPFLFYGAEVTRGSGGMLVTSMGSNTSLGRFICQVTRDPGMTPLPAELDKFGNEDASSKLSQPKGKPSAIEDSIKAIFKKPNGKFSTLIHSLTMSLLGVKGGIPFVIRCYIDYWRNKILSDRAIAQEPLAWFTMGSVSTICIDKIAWQRLNGRAVDIEALKNAGVHLILIFEDKAPGLETLGFEPNGLVLDGENFRNCPDEERMNKVDNMIVMEGFLPSDKLLLMQCLKKNGKRVAIVGGKTDEIPALKEADVGIVLETCSSEMAREISDIIVRDGNFSFLVTIIGCERCTYDNIRKYIQFELAMTIAGLLIPTITTVAFGHSPISVFQMLWVNTVSTFLGGLALMTEPPAEELMDKQPLRQTEPFITKAMWRNLVIQALFQTAILVCFQSEGQAILGISKKVNGNIIFNGFVFCQVFNIVNARELEKKNVFTGIHRNLWLWVAVGGIMVLQVAFNQISHILTGNGSLNMVQWLVCILTGMLLLPTHQVASWMGSLDHLPPIWEPFATLTIPLFMSHIVTLS